jgi:glutathione S-transferase
MGLARTFNVATSYLTSGLRFAAGMRVAGELGPRPAEPLEIYEFEACPFCRRVREALTTLDLEAYIYPCPRGGSRYRPVVIERGKREMFPYMIDPNTGTEMYESADIVDYLFKTYGAGKPSILSRGPLFVVSSALASAARPSRGRSARGEAAPKEPLELYSFEASPYCRIAREELCALELPYLLHNVAKGSPSREAFVARSGKMMVPYLVDPNTDTEMFESADIVEYLRETYG